MRDRRARFGIARGQRGAVEPVLQDRVDVAVRTTADRECAGTSSLEAIATILLVEPDDPEARAEAMLGVLPLDEDLLDELRGVVADRPQLLCQYPRPLLIAGQDRVRERYCNASSAVAARTA